jgi:hypothetical protein
MHQHDVGAQTVATVNAAKSDAEDGIPVFRIPFSVLFSDLGDKWQSKEFIYRLIMTFILKEGQFGSPLFLFDKEFLE